MCIRIFYEREIMATVAEIEQRIEALKQQLKQRREHEKRMAAEQVLGMAKAAGLSILDLQNLIKTSQQNPASTGQKEAE